MMVEERFTAETVRLRADRTPWKLAATCPKAKTAAGEFKSARSLVSPRT